MSRRRGGEPALTAVRSIDVLAKTALLLLLSFAVIDPDAAHLRDKAAGLRAVSYPLFCLTVPLLWFLLWSDRAPFPWVADLLVTLTCFSDILGNQLDLYDQVVWFDDWMHFMNTGLLAAAVVLLTLPARAGLAALLERAVAFGATAAILWELAEFVAFLQFSPERRNAYTDTLGDLVLGLIGAVVAALMVHTVGRRVDLQPPVAAARPADAAARAS